MKNLYLIEPSFVFGGTQVRLPYSTGLIWSYCRMNDIINKNYNCEFLYIRTNIDDFFKKIKNPSVVGFSCFVWNWKFNTILAKKIKEKYPDCLIVFGGQQTPSQDRLKHEQDFFEKNSHVDISVYFEGEVTFEEILVENLKDEPNFKSILGCSVMNSDLSAHTTLPRPRIDDIDSMPSPYLDGLFDELIKDNPNNLNFICTVETVRGCPYRCTFCEIGHLNWQKIKAHTFEKIKKEFEWIAKNGILYVDNADSNFGLYKERDMKISKMLVKLKEKYGYPYIFNNSWAKNKGKECLPIAKVLHDAGMGKGLTLALQSMHKPTLNAIKRKNTSGDDIRGFLKLSKKLKVLVYSELIIGLPEETLESWLSGFFELMDYDQHNYLGIYALSVLPNTPFGDPEYLKKWGVKYKVTAPLFFHITSDEYSDQEYEEICYETDTMPYEDMLVAYYYKWFFQTFHFFGFIQFISRFFVNYLSIDYKYFYIKMLDYFEERDDTVLGQEMVNFKKQMRNVFEDLGDWGQLAEDGRNWEPEEYTSMNIIKEKEKFYREIGDFLLSEICDDHNIVKNIIKYQLCSLVSPDKQYPHQFNVDYNIQEVIEKNNVLKFFPYNYIVDNVVPIKNYNNDIIKWCTDLIWWGRKSSKLKTTLTEIKQYEELYGGKGTIRSRV